MDADADHGRHERIMLLCMYEHTVQSVGRTASFVFELH